VVKGALSRISGGTYELAISGITQDGSVRVSISKSGYTFTSSSRNVMVYSSTITFTSLYANGSSSAATTLLTLNFGRNIPGLSAGDITLDGGNTGAVKGELSLVSGTSYSLAVSGVIQNGTVSVTVSKGGYTFTPDNRQVYIYPSSTVTVPFTGPTEKLIEVERVITHNNSHTNGGTVTLSITGDYTAYAWYLDGAALAETGGSLSLNAVNYTIGEHWLTMVVYTGTAPNQIPWSGEIAIYVMP
jgi:hypothetical protein